MSEDRSDITVIGLGLQERSREGLLRAFPECLLFGKRPEDEANARAYCKTRDRVTLFVDVPASGALVRQRTSALFDYAKVKVIALCEECTDAIYDAALLLEFAGAIPVVSEVETYRRAAASVQRGELWISRDYLSKLARKLLNSPAQHNLSEREKSILKLMLDDISNQEIANQLYISRETVRWHLKSLYAKLGVSDRESARQFAKNLLLQA